jgi:hypothetical protein
MEVICSMDIFSRADWIAINRVRKYKGLHSIADFLLCDGRTVDPWVLTNAPSDSSRVFSVGKPTRADFCLFRRAVEFVSSATLTLPSALGDYVSHPHRKDEWFLSGDGEKLYQATSESSYIEYTKTVGPRQTRFSTSFSAPVMCQGQCPRMIRASVQADEASDSESVRVHSTAKVFRPSSHKRSFLDRICALPNQSLWKHILWSMEMARGSMRACLPARCFS